MKQLVTLADMQALKRVGARPIAHLVTPVVIRFGLYTAGVGFALGCAAGAALVLVLR